MVEALDRLGYRVGALEIDAAHFVPQSRARLFVIAIRTMPPPHLMLRGPAEPFHSPAIRNAVAGMPEHVRAKWIWWRLDTPPKRNTRLADLIDDDVEWDDEAKTERLLELMAPLHRARIDALKRSGRREVGTVFRRIRVENGERVQRAEARFDGIAGCLRTPAGGSSKQILICIEGEQVRSRLLSPREAARLMGAPDHYPLPESDTAALHLFGDAVCVSAVRWLSDHLLAPLAGVAHERQAAP